MKIEIQVPHMGESISEAVVGTILKQNGSAVNADDEILELETDKVNQVIYAPKKGMLVLKVKTGDKVPVGAILGTIETEGTAAREEKTKELPQKAELPPLAPKKEEKPAQTPQSPAVNSPKRFTSDDFIRELHEESIAPTEKLTIPPPEAAPVPSHQNASTQEREIRRKIPSIRQVIAQRLVAAQQQAAMLTTFNEVDMTAIIELRQAYQEIFTQKFGVKLGFMSFFVKAAVSALQAFPSLNSYIDGDEIVQRCYYDLGIAVSTDRGVLVPVVRNCDLLSVHEIEKNLETFAKKSREGKIAVDDLRGGGFTITNGGVFGSLLSTPLLNPPQCGILGMHKIQKRPIAIGDLAVVRPMMYLALSYDHRLIDGKEAVSFLVHIKNMIENPARQLLEV